MDDEHYAHLERMTQTAHDLQFELNYISSFVDGDCVLRLQAAQTMLAQVQDILVTVTGIYGD